MRAIWKSVARHVKDDSGVAGLVIAGLIAIVAFSSLSVFLNKYIGDRTFERARASATGQGVIMPAMLAHYLGQDSLTRALPCPDSKATPDGTADASCNGSTAVAGVLPWVTMGLAKDQVVDGFGNYYTYVLSQTAKQVCSQVTSDLTGATSTTTYTGGMVDPTDLTYTSADGIDRNVPFVVISHGKNGRGAKRASGTDIEDPPGSATYELANVTVATPTDTVYGGPASEDFDDIVLVPTLGELRKTCDQLTPSGKLNAEVSDNFEGAGDLSDTFDTTGSGTPPTKTRDDNGNGVLRFANANSFLATRSDVVLDAQSRPVYVRMLWTAAPETPAAVNAGFSIATRATPSELAAGTDDFTGGSARGITFRFDDRDGSTSSSVGVTNTLSIRNDGAAEAVVGADPSYSLINGETYVLEVYDNGSTVWMRVTQRDDVTNTATVSATVTDDLNGGSQRVVFINGPAISHMDEVTVGLPMLALETGPTAGIARTATSVGGTSTGDLTLEAWIRPKALPAAGARGTIAAQWNTTGSDSQQSFRLYLDGDEGGKLVLEIGGDFEDNGTDDTERFVLGLTPTLDQWTHVAVSFNSDSKAVRFYTNGAFSRAFTSATDTGTGVRSPQRPLSAGAALDSNTPVDFFTGLISDLRVWEVVRTPAEIEDSFDVRLTTAGSEDDLVVNWVFDRESGSIGSSSNVIARPADAANDGVLTGATYAPTLAVYFRPLSTSICPAGTRAGPYQCDFRPTGTSGMTSSINMPNNLTDIYAKVWGAGGGGYDNATAAGTYDTSGGSGGFSQGIIRSINGTSVASQVLDIYVGGGGTGSSTNSIGGAGGGGSGIYTVGGNAGLVAGGGGGSAYSLRNVAGGSTNCNGLVDDTRCGLGGVGGGTSALTVRAPDQSSSCGGRGGDNGPFGDGPPMASVPVVNGDDCPLGGGDPSGRTGGGGGATTGGGPVFIAGGGGYDAGSAFANLIGSGGGGGGAAGGEAGGYRDATNQRAGFGGGGGSGTADAGVLSAAGETGVLQGSDYGSDASSGDRTNGQTLVSLIDPVEILSWQVGYIVVGSGIPNGTTIAAIDTGANTITLSVPATNNNNGTLIVTSPPSAGGSTDPYYSPSYIGTTYRNPGRGGLDATSVNGRAGAVVLLW